MFNKSRQFDPYELELRRFGFGSNLGGFQKMSNIFNGGHFLPRLRLALKEKKHRL